MSIETLGEAYRLSWRVRVRCLQTMTRASLWFRILWAHSEGDKRADIAEHRVPDLRRQLVKILVSDHKADAVLSVI